MKYIVEEISGLILNNAPQSDGEMMIRIDNFEDIKIYEAVARNIEKQLGILGLTVKIKLAKSKWKFFKSTEKDTAFIQSMEQNGWVADAESITYYRNEHDTNVLVLMGTEDEEDRGGLINCFKISPESIVQRLNGDYYKLFNGDVDLGDAGANCVNKLYHDLFEFIALDICKLSNLFDGWTDQISTTHDFVELFYQSLPEWGLPYKMLELPSTRELKSKKNIIRTEYNFISRRAFKKLTKTQYNKCREQIEQYRKDEYSEYTEDWPGWEKQGIKSYAELSDIILSYVRGEKVNEYKGKLLATDFSIIEAILDFKIQKEKKPRNTVPTITGEPLVAFTESLLQMLCDLKTFDEITGTIATLEFNIKQAEVVSMYSETEDEEEKQQLYLTWKTICRHINGVFEYLNRQMWCINDDEIDIKCTPDNIFLPKSAMLHIDLGCIKAASPNKTINKIDFDIKCKNAGGEIVRCGRKALVQSFQWKFNSTEEWLHSFSDICSQDRINELDRPYIPVATIGKMTSLIFAKSEEEFFDLYDENDISFGFDMAEYVDVHSDDSTKLISAQFDKLGKRFVKFIKTVADEGLYVCILKEQSELLSLTSEYCALGNILIGQSLPENQKWILDAYIHSFNIEESLTALWDDTQFRCCIVPPWHPTALEKLNDQKIFFLDGCVEWWNDQNCRDKVRKIDISNIIDNLVQMSMMQSSLDIFPSYGQQYFGAIHSFGAFSIYGRRDIENNSRLKDMIHKDAIYDDDFDSKENAKMSDNAKMIYGVLTDYLKAFPDAYQNLSVVFVDTSELQPIIASIYKFVDTVKKVYPEKQISINIKILVKPENKGGKNYLAYWMDECFSQDANVSIRTYLNEWRSKTDIEKLLNGNNDIVFVMDLLKVNNLKFVKESGALPLDISQCRYPIVFKPSPVSDTSSNNRRKIELSQPQFKAAYVHTQIVRYRNNSETIPVSNFIAVKEVCIDEDAQNLVAILHQKAYWVVCVDSGMDGALLRNGLHQSQDYSIIGFSTGKGAYGQYNLTVTARKSILDTIQTKLERRLYQLFHWDKEQIDEAAGRCIEEAGGLDGISLLSAINPKDHNVNEFMAYVLTSLRERERDNDCALKVVVHLDSYKHWFTGELEKDADDSQSRPDFLVLEVVSSEEKALALHATVTECKIASYGNSTKHKEKALKQVKHGIDRLKTIFDPNSKSIRRRYWYAQLYRALAFAQITFSDNSNEFEEVSSKLRAVLDGNFEIDWDGKVLGYWLDMDGSSDIEIETEHPSIKLCDIPQKRIQQLLLAVNQENVTFIDVSEDNFIDEEELENRIVEREKEVQDELINRQEFKRTSIEYDIPSKNVDSLDRVADEDISHSYGNQTEILEKSTDDSLHNADDKKNEIVEATNTQEESPIKIIKDLDATRVLIGKDKLQGEVFWEFGHKQLANRHLLITGTSGQGKTYSIQTMLYELSKSNVSAVIFDYTEGFRLDQLETEFVKRMDNHINQRVVKFENVPINPFKRQFIEFSGIKYPEKDSDVAARFANIMTHVYGFGDQQSAAIFDAVRVGLAKYHDDMNMIHFQEELENEKQVNKSAQTVISKMQPFFYGIEFEEKSEFDWGNVIYPEQSTATIFQLTAIDRDMQVIITELMLWDLWYYTTKNGNKDKPFVVVLDEAQNLSHKDKSPSCKILTEGRKFGWSAWYATQSLKVLDDEEVTRLMQSAFKLYFKPTDDEIIKMSKQLEPTDSSSWLNALKGLKKGQCIVVGERIKKDGKFGLIKPTITSVSSFEQRS